MKRKRYKYFLPMISIGMMIMGMHGLKETTFESMVAETPNYYTPISPQATGESLNQAIRLNSPHDNLKPSFTFLFMVLVETLAFGQTIYIMIVTTTQ